MDKAATQELASGGNVSSAVSSLNQRASVLKSQQDTLTALQQTATDATINSNAYGNAYSNGFSSFGSFRR